MRLSEIVKKITLKQTLFLISIKKGFKSLYPIYSIDLTSQPQNVSGAKNSVILRAEFNTDVKGPSENDEGTLCYIVLVSKCMFCYEPSKNKIT
jgi:hypothetical protein